MGSRLPIVIALIMLISGCASASGKYSVSENKNSRKSAAEILGFRHTQEDLRDGTQILPNMGYTRPYMPVIQPAEVKKVWIPAHPYENDSDTLVAGHWVYVKIRDEEWFINQERKDESNFPIIIPTASIDK